MSKKIIHFVSPCCRAKVIFDRRGLTTGICHKCKRHVKRDKLVPVDLKEVPGNISSQIHCEPTRI